MQYIPKSLSNEPTSLRIYRTSTPNASYEGFGSKEDIRKAVLKEQGYLCAYCMNRITEEYDKDLNKVKTEIEHYKSQNHYPSLQLDFYNMLGVCNGCLQENINEKTMDCISIYNNLQKKYSDLKRLEKRSGVSEHCDKSKGDSDLCKLDPRKKDCEEILKYSKDGSILSSVDNDIEVKYDIKCVLNLNHGKLVQFRKNVLDVALEKMKKEKPEGIWTKDFIQKHIEKWKEKNQEGHLKAFYRIVVWHLNEFKKKNKYQ